MSVCEYENVCVVCGCVRACQYVYTCAVCSGVWVRLRVFMCVGVYVCEVYVCRWVSVCGMVM